MADVKQCDGEKCGKIIPEGEIVADEFVTSTNLISLKAWFTVNPHKKGNQDYCIQCAHKAVAEAGLKLWEEHKRTSTPSVKKKEAKNGNPSD